MIKAYEAGQCNVLTTDESGLFAMRLQLGACPSSRGIFGTNLIPFEA
jgi:hypothetical protein